MKVQKVIETVIEIELCDIIMFLKKTKKIGTGSELRSAILLYSAKSDMEDSSMDFEGGQRRIVLTFENRNEKES